MNEDIFVKLPKLNEHLTVMQIANLRDDGSQGGHVALVTDKQERYFSPIAWQFKRIKQIVKGISAAETSSLVGAAATCFWLAKIIDEIFGYREKIPQIKCYIQIVSLYLMRFIL